LHQNVTIPWAALTHALDDATLVYASWGRGLETGVAPNQPFYTNAGEPLPALKSRQVELGIKRRGSRYRAGLALFDIERPQPETLANADGSATYAVDGSARHRGVEAQFGWDAGAWRGDASLLLLDAERQGASDPTLDGTRPVNVPRRSLRVGAGYRVPQTVVGSRVELRADLAAEPDRPVLPGDDRTRIGGWARLDLGARAEQRLGASKLTWRIGVDNVLDRRAWKESPYQFGHVYLYPLEPRRWRASLELAF
jgi:iron complex outermembrane receptor protein